MILKPVACFTELYFSPPISALIRPGRFDMQVTVPRPDVRGRTEILKWYLNKIKYDPCEYKHLPVIF